MSEENANEGQEKSFDASESKIKKSREKGDTPQSQEANTFMLYVSLVVVILMFGSTIVRQLFESLSAMLAQPDYLAHVTLIDENGQGFESILSRLVVAVAPLFLMPMLFILVSLIVQRAIVVAPEKLKPKLSRISPISNAKQKYGMTGMVEFLKRLAKMSFIAVIAGIFFYQVFFNLPGLSGLPRYFLLEEMRQEAVRLTLYMLIGTGLITLVDLPYAQFAHLKKLRMTFQEVKDEAKDNEGDPYLKRERRMRAESMMKSSMLRDVATADVIIVNPTHYAVALKWSRDSGEVPVCVAKGVDEMAFRIRERAEEHDISIYSDPPCARSLHALVEVGEAIRYEHYAAVAAAIHFADQAKTKPY